MGQTGPQARQNKESTPSCTRQKERMTEQRVGAWGQMDGALIYKHTQREIAEWK